MSTAGSPPPPEPELPEIERSAAEWVVRLQHPLTAAEEKAMDRWLKQDRRHAEILAEMRETSQRLSQLRGSALAGATVVPARAEWTDHAGAMRPQWRGAWPAAAGLAAAAVVLIAGLWWRTPAESPSFTQTAATEVGGLRQLELPDGSVVQLNTNSELEVAYTATARRVQLARGEAFFDVARDPQRPFRVTAGAITVRAIGTAFNVHHRAGAVEVLVREGKVSVDPVEAPAPIAGSPPSRTLPASRSFDRRLLVAGEKALISTALDVTATRVPVIVARVEATQMESALAWRSRRLEFSDSPLSKVVAEFNRYNRHQLVIDEPSLGAMTFGGAFAADGYKSLVEILEQSFGVTAERREGETVLRLAR